MRVLTTEPVEPDIGLRQTEGFVCEGRPCRVQVRNSVEPTLLNSPALAPPAPDVPVVG